MEQQIENMLKNRRGSKITNNTWKLYYSITNDQFFVTPDNDGFITDNQIFKFEDVRMAITFLYNL